jgi:hypothetical protein
MGACQKYTAGRIHFHLSGGANNTLSVVNQILIYYNRESFCG